MGVKLTTQLYFLSLTGIFTTFFLVPDFFSQQISLPRYFTRSPFMSNIFWLFSLNFASKDTGHQRNWWSIKNKQAREGTTLHDRLPSIFMLMFPQFPFNVLNKKKIIKQLQTFTFWHQYGLFTRKSFLKASINLIGKNVIPSQHLMCGFLREYKELI